MRTERPKSLLHRTAESDFWRHSLLPITGLTERLVYLSALRSGDAGRYEHDGLTLLYGEKDADKAIRNSHRKVFQEWLAMGLREKVADFQSYLDSTGTDARRIFHQWATAASAPVELPAGSAAAEKTLFQSDVRNVLAILNSQFGADDSRRSA